MSVTSLLEIEEYFKTEARSGKINSAMFRSWADLMASTVRRNEQRGAKKTSSSPPGGKTTEKRKSKDEPKGKPKGKEKSSDSSKSKGASKSAGPEVLSKKDKADLDRRSALVKLDNQFGNTIPKEILGKPWKEEILPFLLTTGSQAFYEKAAHYLSGPIEEGQKPAKFESMSESEQAAAKRKVLYASLFSKAKLNADEMSASRSYFLNLPGRIVNKD